MFAGATQGFFSSQPFIGLLATFYQLRIREMVTKSTDNAIDRALFFDIEDMAREFKCSKRHITNLRNREEIPQPIKLGARVLWPRKTIDDWISGGCQALAV